SKFEIIKLRERLNFVGEFIPHVYSFSAGILFACGSRDEVSGSEGLTHLLEHMLFKGTNRRSAKELFKKIESLGGSFDAYTTKENMIIMTRFLREYQDGVVDIILEMLNEAALPDEEFGKEKSIILEEIKSTNEDPEDRVFDLFFETVFKPHQIANPIVGYKTTVERLGRENILDHFDAFISQPITFSVAGNYDQESVLNRINSIRIDNKPIFKRSPPVFHPRRIGFEARKDLSQVYVVLATEGVPFVDDRRYAMNIISSALGGGMSSRLFLRLRETEGLVYNVQTFNEFFTDIGIFGIFFITDQKNLGRCLDAIGDELKELGNTNFSNEELNIHRSLIKGNFLIGLESTTNRMLRLGRSLAQLKEIPSVSDITSIIESIDQKSVAPLLKKICDQRNYSIAVVGKAEEEEIRSFFKL
ncbi:MAG TPA: insulinase family protein, partial [bacterium (Candidatus Stahlbacteria)]|nr:insulinase family protein [Candidatus Stahlbacteria bacterium]